MQDDPLREKAEKKAFRLLTLRAHSEHELAAKLRERGFSEGVVAGVVEKCRELGYLNDGEFARQRARELAVNRLLGDRRIVLDLREKGIPEALSRRAIEEVRGEIGEERAIEVVLRKKGPRKGPRRDGREGEGAAHAEPAGERVPHGPDFQKIAEGRGGRVSWR